MTRILSSVERFPKTTNSSSPIRRISGSPCPFNVSAFILLFVAPPRFAQSCRKAVCQPVADEHLEPNEELRLLRREAGDMKAALAVRLGVHFIVQNSERASEGERCGGHHCAANSLGGNMWRVPLYRKVTDSSAGTKRSSSSAAPIPIELCPMFCFSTNRSSAASAEYVCLSERVLLLWTPVEQSRGTHEMYPGCRPLTRRRYSKKKHERVNQTKALTATAKGRLYHNIHKKSSTNKSLVRNVFVALGQATVVPNHLFEALFLFGCELLAVQTKDDLLRKLAEKITEKDGDLETVTERLEVRNIKRLPKRNTRFMPHSSCRGPYRGLRSLCCALLLCYSSFSIYHLFEKPGA